MEPDSPFTREEALAGLPARRARALLFSIEILAAKMAERSLALVAMAATFSETPFMLPVAAGDLMRDGDPVDEETGFLTVLGHGRGRLLAPTIRQIEQYASDWAPLVPDNPRLRAAVARLLSKKHRFAQLAVPRIRAALGLDEPAVREEYQRQYGEPLETIYAPGVSRRERLRWAVAAFGAWLEALPPFWLAFAFTLTESVGVTTLVLPIAMATVGPLAGASILILVGALNVLTEICLAEAVVRSGAIRYGQAYLGRMIADYLGPTGSLLFTTLLWLMAFLLVQALTVGFATAMAGATRIPPTVWTMVLFSICLYVISRRTFHASAASALLVGAVNICLILVLSALAFAHARPENLRYVSLPWVGGRPFDPALLSLVFGVPLVGYFGHFAAANCARLTLQRDPTGRGLIGGCAAAMVVATVLYCLFVIAVNGAVGPQALEGSIGTALEPLANVVGPGVWVLGTVYVLLGLGMGSILYSLGLFNLVAERLPSRSRFLATLKVGGGRLILEPASSLGEQPRIGLTYLGLRGGRPRLRIDVQVGSRLHTLETSPQERWETREICDRVPALKQHRLYLSLEVVEASSEGLSLMVHSTLSARCEATGDGAGLLRLFDLPEALWRLVPWLTRRGEVSLAEAAAHTGMDTEATRAALEALSSEGVVQKVTEGAEARYRAWYARRRTRALPEQIWQALEEADSAAVPPSRAGASPAGPRGRLRIAPRFQDALLSDRGRLLVSASPVAAAFLITGWLFFRGSESLSGLLNFIGLILISILGGVFPVLLLVASRRKGEYVPGFAWRFLGRLPVVAGIYLTFLSIPLVHGLIIWQSLPARAAALAAAVLTAAMTLTMARRGAFNPRAVVELREAPPGAVFAVMAEGRPLVVAARLVYPEGERPLQAASGPVPDLSSLRSISFTLPPTRARELKVWIHRVTPDGDSEPLPALVEVRCGSAIRQVDLGLYRGQVVLPITGAQCRLQITFAQRLETGSAG